MPLPYFPFYRDDWRSSTAVQAMSLEEEGAYIRLLSHMWGFEGVCSLPDDEEVLVRIVKTPRRKWRALRKVLVDGPLSVFESRDGRLYNHRLSEEWEKATTKSRKATAAIQTRYERSTDVVRTKNGRSTDEVPPRDLRSQIPDQRSHNGGVDLRTGTDQVVSQGQSPPPVYDDSTSQIEQVLAPYLDTGMTAPKDRREVERWVRAGATPDMFPAALDAGLAKFQERNPDRKPMSASWYGGYIASEVSARQTSREPPTSSPPARPHRPQIREPSPRLPGSPVYED